MRKYLWIAGIAPWTISVLIYCWGVPFMETSEKIIFGICLLICLAFIFGCASVISELAKFANQRHEMLNDVAGWYRKIKHFNDHAIEEKVLEIGEIKLNDN